MHGAIHGVLYHGVNGLRDKCMNVDALSASLLLTLNALTAIKLITSDNMRGKWLHSKFEDV